MRRHVPRPQRPNPRLRQLVDTLRHPDDPAKARADVRAFHADHKGSVVTATQAKAHFEKLGYRILRPVVDTLVHYGVACKSPAWARRPDPSSAGVSAPWTLICGVLKPATGDRPTATP